MNGGGHVARVLAERGTRFLFTLCGGHISPILVEAKRRGIRILDLRDERSAVFAADAAARLTGQPAVAAVTAGPGATNAVTAVKNAQLAQVPLVLLGGATATLLKGRGSLQDIDQLALLRPHVKWAASARRVRELGGLVGRAYEVAQEGVPGPVFVECPVDLLYGEEVVRGWYEGAMPRGDGLRARFLRAHVRRHQRRLFAGAAGAAAPRARAAAVARPASAQVARAARLLLSARRPVLLLGSQSALDAGRIGELAAAAGGLGAPVFLAGMARGLLGAAHPLHIRHRRREALREADVAVLAGVPCDFRLDYGRQLGRAAVVSANRSRHDLRRNRRPRLAVHADPGLFVRALAAELAGRRGDWQEWVERLRARDRQREEEIEARTRERLSGGLNPLSLLKAVDAALGEDSVVVADGGDFVATASYVVRPRGPLSWLDPGVFGTLGVGGGFALGARICRPQSEVWLLWGDGSAAFSLAEFDTFARHGLGMVAVVGNDGSWAQIAREQVALLGDDVGTVLDRAAYHRAAEGFGGKGLLLERAEDTEDVLAQARAWAAEGHPVLVNAVLGASDFRKGSLSM